MFQGRGSIQETLLVELSAEGLTFHFRIHTPMFEYEGMEGIVLYAHTSDIPRVDYVLVKVASAATLLCGLLIAVDGIPAVAASTQPLPRLVPTVLKAALMLLFALHAVRFLAKRRAVGEALSVLRRDPLGSLGEGAKDFLMGSLQGDPLGSLRDEVAKLALGSAPPRAWALMAPMCLFASVLWWAVQPWL
jgi:hypothetical protein